ncbi:MAG: phosphoribosyltransferase family protein [Azospirillaceae bacterium]
MRFEDRRRAGERLAAKLRDQAGETPLVLALPRGGVPVAVPIAEALGASLDLLLVRKIGVPGHPEYAAGAVADGAAPQIVRNEEVIAAVGLGDATFARLAGEQLREIESRRRRYLGDRASQPVQGRTVIVVDDGIATGATMQAGLRALRSAGARRVVVATPVAPADAVSRLKSLADAVVVLDMPEPFHSVGEHYVDFRQVADDEVVALLGGTASRHRHTRSGPNAGQG